MLAVAFVIGACSKKADAPKSECAAVVERGVDLTIAKRRKNQPAAPDPAADEVPAKLKGVLTKLCIDDKWSPEVISCLKTAEDIAVCKAKLTPEQRSNYTREAMNVMMGGRRMGGPPGMRMPHETGSAGAPAGSADPGSAAAGSADPATGSN